MYMGFMKTGLSLMCLFVMMVIVTTWLNLGALPAICIVVWFYGFFHANHLASLTDEEFEQVEDGYLFGLDELPALKNVALKYNKWVAFLLIFLGVCLLLDTFASFLSNVLPEGYRFISRMLWRIGDYLPRVLIGLGIIYMGMKMMSGKRLEQIQEIGYEEEPQNPEADPGQEHYEQAFEKEGSINEEPRGRAEGEIIQDTGAQEDS